VQQQAPTVEELIRRRIDVIERTTIAKTVTEYRRILKAQTSGSGFRAAFRATGPQELKGRASGC